MAAKDVLKSALQALADASGSAILRVGLGAPGAVVEVNDETKDTGQGYAVPGSLDSMLGAHGQVLDSYSYVQGGLTNGSGSTLLAGAAVRVSGAGQVQLASATSAAQGKALVGFMEADANVGAAAAVRTGGLGLLRFAAGLTLTVGDDIFLSDSTSPSGVVTNVAPVGAGKVKVRVGTLVDTSAYAGSTKAIVAVRMGDPLVL